MRFLIRCSAIAFSSLLFLLSACSTSIQVPQTSAPTLSGPEMTGTVVVSRKATEGARMFLTETAQPTETSTPAVPAMGSTPCKPADLTEKATSEGATASMAISLHLTNTSANTCVLQGPPDVQLVDSSGQPLNIQVQNFCFQCNPTTGTLNTPEAPTATAEAQAALHLRLALQPGQSAIVFMLWNNWCEPFPEGGVNVQLSLPGSLGQVTAPSNARTGGRCDAKDQPSTLLVSEYSRQ